MIATFREPDTQPNDSIFVGTFTFDASGGRRLRAPGRAERVDDRGPIGFPDDSMTWVTLGNQPSARPVVLDGAQGLLVTRFRLGATDTLARDPQFGGTDGWAPGSGSRLHFGFPGANPGKRLRADFVNAAEPTAAPTPGQLDKLAYADCAPAA